MRWIEAIPQLGVGARREPLTHHPSAFIQGDNTMHRAAWRLWACLLGALPALAATPNATVQAAKPSALRPVVLVYAGAPVCSGCEQPVLDLIRKPKTPALQALAPESRVIRRWADIPKALKSLPPRSVFLIPGTEDDLRAWAQGGSQAMSAQSIRAIQQWVHAGGRYAGICGGAIIAQARYEDEQFAFDALNLAKMEADNFAGEDAIERIEPVHWLPKQMTFGAYFQAGSVMTLLPSKERSEVWATYLATKGRVQHPAGIAAAMFSYGQGKVFVSGVHLEATHDFWDQAPPDFVPHTELLEAVLADLMQDRPIGRVSKH
ncbi:hypothetical protein [Chitinimonas taiwanensis]|nr:hypothetical protein [Chitinimonas taiwanensis]